MSLFAINRSLLPHVGVYWICMITVAAFTVVKSAGKKQLRAEAMRRKFTNDQFRYKVYFYAENFSLRFPEISVDVQTYTSLEKAISEIEVMKKDPFIKYHFGDIFLMPVIYKYRYTGKYGTEEYTNHVYVNNGEGFHRCKNNKSKYFYSGTPRMIKPEYLECINANVKRFTREEYLEYINKRYK